MRVQNIAFLSPTATLVYYYTGPQQCFAEPFLSALNYLCGQCLISSMCKEIANDVFVVFLSGHVERSEPIQRLHIHVGSVFHENSDDDRLPGQRCNVQTGVSLLKFATFLKIFILR